ncbi:FAD-dependent oxidoreductase [Olivibacter sitiensis]|uniref:FAD-dependent oxidoreductase n=1 Tax=Olivibacter sitiensis TaxID=376470 RepID=UPI000410E78D|nr:FAD-dependent oxidoreductase [Olivibacter sitiensis]
MPILRKPTNQIELTLAPRKASLAADTDVLIVGGGPAGIGAAIGAAQSGAKVTLVERLGFLGGNATAALVMPLMSFHTQQYRPAKSGYSKHFLPNDHGPGTAIIAGALSQLLSKLVQAGAAIAPSLETGYVVPFDPELFKMISLDLLDEHGVDILFHAFASGIYDDGNKKGAILETKSGPLVITAKTIIDCSGDGDIAVAAGAQYHVGRETDGLVQPISLMFRMVEFQRTHFGNYVKQHPDQWRGVHGLWDLIEQATKAGELDLPREDILFFDTPHPHELSVNSTRITQVLGIDVWDLSYAEWEGRRQVRQIADFLKKYVPGFEKSYVAQTGVTVGVRETRRIVGDYTLTTEDVLSAQKFDDGVAKCSYPIDVHNPEGKGTVLKRLPPGEAYDIPLRCLLPKDVDGILVAGRCISGSHEAHSSYRVMPTAMAMGQAAGVCASIASRQGIFPRAVDAADVQQELIRQGAIVS